MPTLFHYIQSLILRLRNHGRQRSAEIYATTLRSFIRYRAGRDLPIRALNSAEVEAYAAWLKARAITPNTSSFYMRTLRAIYNRAVSEGLAADRRPFRHVYTGIDKTIKRALPIPTIRRIHHLDLSAKPKAAFARDIFVLSFYLRGMSFVDICFLKKSDLHDGYLIYRRRKTGQRLLIKWTPEMQAILDRHPAPQSEYLLPIIDPRASDPRRAYLLAFHRINRHLKRIGALIGAGIPLTLYVARHSWASAARSADIPLSVISAGMGHDSEKTTRIYLSTLDTTAVDNANTHLISALQ